VEVTPLLPSERKPAGRGRMAVVAVAALACVGAVALASQLGGSRAALLADGVEPISKLSFTRAEKSHFKAAKRLDDVSSRSAVDSYFNKLEGAEEKQHASDERHAKKASSMQQSLNGYFAKLGASYQKEATQHMQARAARHPGKLAHHVKFHHVNAPAKRAAKAAGGEARSEANTEEGSSQLTADNKVKIGFYMESMCPGCKYYTTHVLKALMEKPEFRQMVDVEVFPYGNGQLSGTQIACQHGADECEGNKVIACMQKLYPITDADAGFFPAFACMEAKDGKPYTEGQTCANDNNLDWSQIQTCVAGTDGSSLALSAAQATEGLSPAHEYAPWLTLNASPLRDDAYNLAAKVCDAYTGLDKPAMCSADAVKADEGQALRVINDIGFSVCPREAGRV